MQFASETASNQRVFLRFNWSEFEQFLLLRGDRGGSRITYLDGVLEIMSPSKMHESIKKRIARLLELWAEHTGVEIAGFGSTTLTNASSEAGAEPDECYVIGRSDMSDVPDLAIEVNWTTRGIDKLQVYFRLGVPEVWVWEDNQLAVYVRGRSEYIKGDKSAAFPALDLAFFSTFVADTDQLRALRNFRAALQRH